jgi:hypothetical protein
MSNKAERDFLELLHSLTAQQLTKVLTDGIPIVNRETGEIEGTMPASAAYFATAIKFLKDNDITADLSKNSDMQGLISALPMFGDDENHDDMPMQ